MANTLKAEKERYNQAMTDGRNLIELARTEVRSLTDDENSKLIEYREIASDANKSIKDFEEQRDLNSSKETDGTKITEKHNEVNDLALTKEQREQKVVLEQRSMEAFLRRNDAGMAEVAEEYRALDPSETNQLANSVEGTHGNGGITVPTSVYNSIVEMLGEDSPVFAKVQKFGSVTGNLKIAREDDMSDEGFIGELKDASMLVPTLKSVTLTQKRVGAAVQLTQALVNDSGVNILSYSQKRLSRSVGKAIERGILVGDTDVDNSFHPIIGDAGVLKQERVAAGVTVEDLLDIYGQLNPGYLNGAMWVLSREVFNVIMKLKDGDGTYLIFRGIVEGKPGYSLFGAPVYVSDVLKGDNAQSIIFGNFQAGYGMLVKKGMNLVNVTADSRQALAGGMLSVLDTYMDGAVYNPRALVVGTVKKP